MVAGDVGFYCSKTIKSLVVVVVVVVVPISVGLSSAETSPSGRPSSFSTIWAIASKARASAPRGGGRAKGGRENRALYNQKVYFTTRSHPTHTGRFTLQPEGPRARDP